MDISFTSMSMSYMASSQKKNDLGIKPLYTQKVEGDELKELKKQVQENLHAFTFNIEITQVSVTNIALGQNDDKFQQDYEKFQNFLKEIGYEGKKIADLTQDEAKELVSEEGFFGIKQTSERIANFVIQGANGNEELLRVGLEGIMQGFSEAEEMWGDTLPDISYQTIERSQKLIQQEMAKLGYSVLDTSA